MNWGHKLTIGMALFMAFISIMVFKMIKSKVDLVADNYYESGITYQQKIQSQKNGTSIQSTVMVDYLATDELLHIQIPAIDNGKVLLYCPSDKRNDFELPLLSVNDIDLKSKPKGKWKAKLNWKFENVDYALEKEFWIK